MKSDVVFEVIPKSTSADGRLQAELELLRSDLWTTVFRGGYSDLPLLPLVWVHHINDDALNDHIPMFK